MATEQRIALRAGQWRAGEGHVDRLPAPDGPVVERVVEELVAELRRRLGGTFSALELVELHDDGTPWALALATRAAPGHPAAWDGRVVDAAFARYLREARDWAGGRLVVEDA